MKHAEGASPTLGETQLELVRHRGEDQAVAVLCRLAQYFVQQRLLSGRREKGLGEVK